MVGGLLTSNKLFIRLIEVFMGSVLFPTFILSFCIDKYHYMNIAISGYANQGYLKIVKMNDSIL